jgi:FkbM family methyltransferase
MKGKCMSDSSSASLRSSASRESLWLGREQPALNALKEELVGCGLFIDVGANIGDYTYLANAYLNNANVICLEPNVDLNPVLEETISAAKSESNHNNSFQIINKVISDTTGTIDFFVASNPTLSSINDRNNQSDKRVIESIPLDSLYQPGIKTFIKMDIEGAEYQAVKSGKQFLQSGNTKFLIELHSWGDKSLKKYPLNVATLFLMNGYRIRKIDPTYVFGSHYIFEKGSYLSRLTSYLFYFPLFLAQYILYRFFEKNAQKLVNYLRRFK